MRINNNLMALNTHRQLGLGNTAAAKSMEKLSSGYRINRAGDDAAGLAISEKMRGQIRGLTQASRNAQDGISLIQTAEGALNETHAILQRMRELAVQSATDTNTNVDRNEIQAEIDQLAAELTRIAETTEFNTQNLLGGMFKAKFHIGANQGQNVDLEINSMSAAALEVAGDITYVADSVVISATYTEVNNDNVDPDEGQTPAVATIESGTYTVGGTEGAYTLLDSNGVVVATSTDGITFTGTGGNDGTADKIEFGSALKIGTEVVIDISETTATATISHDGITVANNGLDTGVYTVTAEGIVNSKDEIVATYDSGKDGYVNTEGDVVLAGDELAANTELKVGGINVSSQDKADIAITTINDAIESVSAERSKLGAMQNRLEHTIKNLDTSAENLQAAESRIRDVDMAKEMMEFTKQNILQQAAQAMLAHANQAPQGVLQLLR